MGNKKNVLIGFFSFFFILFCFPSPLTSDHFTPQCLQEELSSLKIASQVWLFDQELPPQKIKKLSTDYKKLRVIFRELTSLSLEIKRKTNVGASSLHREKNRTMSFLPYDENRTCGDVLGFYISASDIWTPEQIYIAAQAPLKHTVSDFWYTLIERNCPLIVTTALPVEKGEDKCYPYWKKEALPITVNGWRIKNIGEDEVLGESEEHHLTKRLFLCTHEETKKKKVITQLHYENWPDNGVPDLTLFIKLLNAVDEMKLPKELPITVHCSAGIGRSGTFIASHSLRRTLLKAKKDTATYPHFTMNIPETIFLLRMQRKSMVANTYQMQIVFQALAHEI